jgi:hypothetical protein
MGVDKKITRIIKDNWRGWTKKNNNYLIIIIIIEISKGKLIINKKTN